MRLLSKVFSFQGRDTRADYLSYIGLSALFVMASGGLVIAITEGTGTGGSDEELVLLALVIAVTAVIRVLSSCRRFRDMGRSPWLTLLYLVPLINLIVLWALLFAPSAPTQDQSAALA